MKQKNQIEGNTRNNDIFKDYHPVIGVVGLGYVGLPVALGFSRRYRVIGYDIKLDRIQSLQKHIDDTNQVSRKALMDASIDFTNDENRLHECDVLIITVPTPLTLQQEPDLSYLVNASKTIGQNMKNDTIIIYESTVFPGATEEICIPILEEYSGFHCGKEFYVGYSPERINPGDKSHTFSNTEKIVAAIDKKTLEKIFYLYQSVIDAPVYKASSIQVAEAAKLVENTQRDINIAFMNELSNMFRHMGLNTHEVLDAAMTKWNFIPFNPGLVGGHCIGVDPFYFIYKSRQLGYNPELITIARELNDRMPAEIVSIIMNYVEEKGLVPSNLRIGLLGLTFKEDVPDLRNSKSIELARQLKEYEMNVLIYDPVMNHKDVPSEFDLSLVTWDQLTDLDLLILAVSHQEFRDKNEEDFIKLFNNQSGLIVDVKGICKDFDFGREIEVISL